MKKLPDSEFEIMKILWENEPPVSTNDVVAKLDDDKGWLPQTVLTLLVRLVNKGFVRSEKRGKERIYFPVIKKEEYFSFETSSFMKRFHKNSVVTLVNTLYEGKKLSDDDIDDLITLLKDKKN